MTFDVRNDVVKEIVPGFIVWEGYAKTDQKTRVQFAFSRASNSLIGRFDLGESAWRLELIDDRQYALLELRHRFADMSNDTVTTPDEDDNNEDTPGANIAPGGRLKSTSAILPSKLSLRVNHR